MFDDRTYENILEEMLDKYPDDIDTTEGSPVYNAVAGQAAENARFYTFLEAAYKQTFADSAEDEYLERRVAEFGINRKRAKKAIKKGVFTSESGSPFDISIGSRFFIDELHYIALERIELGAYRLECEIEGVVGNIPSGDMLPLDNITGLANAQLTDVLVAGEDEESDEALYERYVHSMNEPAFGGNISDYKEKINAMQGVGGVKVFPTWNGGGTVKCTIISADYSMPSAELINSIQTEIDPEGNQGKGIGLAPIGHTVTIAGVQKVMIDVLTTVTLEPGMTAPAIKPTIEQVLSDYLLILRKNWKDEEKITVRTAQIDARLLTLPGVIDISGTTINGIAANLELGQEEIPALGAVTVNG